MSDIHRRDDFLWSSVGLFYALVLWFCASRITGSLLLGQAAAVALVISFNWQNLKLRKALAHPDEAMDTSGFSVTGLISGWFNRSGETNPQPNITDVLEEETNVEKPTTEIQNPINTATKEETTEAISSFTLEQTDDEPVTEIQNPVNIATEQETVETSSSDEAFFSTIENNLTESNTTSNLGIDTTTEQEAIEPTVEEELLEIKEDESTRSNIHDLAEDATSVQETTEVEKIDSTSTNFNFESQSEETNEEKPIDVKFTTSEDKENTQSSIDDFLAELDQNIDKPSQDK